MMRLREFALCLASLGLFACDGDPVAPADAGGDAGVGDTGGPPGDTGPGDVGPGPDTGPGPDVGPQPGPDETTISGVVYRLDSYLRGDETTLLNANITPLGVQGVSPAVSGAMGEYSMIVPKEGLIVFEAEKPLHYTTYETIEVGADPVTKNLYLATENYVDFIATTYNVDIDTSFNCHAPNPTNEQCYYAIVMGRIVDDGTEQNGRPSPQAGIQAADFEISYDDNTNWYKKGPYFLGSDGQPNAGYTTSQRERNPMTNYYEGGLFVTFLEMPVAGGADKDFKFYVNSTQQNVSVYYGPYYVKAFRQGLSWTTIAETGRDNPPPPPPPPLDPVDFDTQIYPLLQTVDQGGLGCVGCHGSQGGQVPEAGMDFYGGPEVAYGQLNPANYPQRVNVQNPDASYLLTKPLYEQDGVQNHPIFAFASPQDPNYIRMRAWIAQGGVRDVVVQPQVSFYNDIRPLLYAPSNQGGVGCYACHVDGVNANNAPGGAYFGGDGNELHTMLTQTAPSDNGNTGEAYLINKDGNVGYSLLLTNPLQGNQEPHPVKLFYGAEDPRFQTIYQWIQEGWVNDTP